ncbi:sensor histidine kinase [Variovorax saccharolyticus]|uniref:sensor histidine kinase n=1 Tax=Variovorax saccharolyticus TaxID=3053516 RepID=UPI002577D5C4|nr:ATP-binding protein [Variovorax sp. J31P216]MDM0029362.1 ATP-binding protein [Variovorax sp. J31P216]
MTPSGARRARSAIVALCLLMAGGCAVAGHGSFVLVLYSNGRLVPGNIDVEAGLRSAIDSSAKRPVQIFSEFLDRPEFVGEAYENTMTTYLHDKYADHPPAVVVAVARDSLDFVLRHREALFPGVPVVHSAVFASFPTPLRPMPADVVGVPVDYDIGGTIEQALRWHPKTERIYFVTGSTPRDRQWDALLRDKAARLGGHLQPEFLAGLPIDDLTARLRELAAGSLVFTPGFYQSGDAQWFSPRDSVELIAQASAVPVYGTFSTFVGTGAVGGRVPRFEAMGRQAGEIVNSLLGGAAAASLELPERMPNTLNVDLRQTRRWGISDADIPSDAVVEFKQPTFWEAYRTAALIGATVILLQAGLIAALMLEHRRRRKAEVALVQRGSELAHASRLAIAGELTASIAHEINQPLAAILANTEAAELMLKSGHRSADEIGSILADIRRDDLRASDVIARLRALLAKHTIARQPLELNEAIAQGCALIEGEARRRSIELVMRPSTNPVQIVGDRIQIQQVLINLVLNAMDAVDNLPEPRRTIVVAIAERADSVSVTVSDRGHGIAPDDLPKLFDSFFSTKRRGMGLGLSITRSIVEAHGGRIGAASTPGESTVFHVELPIRVEAHAGHQERR